MYKRQIIRLLELHMEEHREDIASLLGEVYRPWDEDGQPGGTPVSYTHLDVYKRQTLSTVAFRGTSPSHTQVTWNGMRINNPMLGMTDFSTIRCV